MSTKQPSNNMSTEVDGESDPTLQELLAQGVERVKKLDVMIHEELRHKPEAIAEWDAMMRENADVFAEHEKEVEERKLDREIHELLDRIDADVERFLNREPPDLEIEEALARSFARMHELDAIMRLRYRDYPEKLATWEEAMDSLSESEAIFKAALEEENAQPGN